MIKCCIKGVSQRSSMYSKGEPLSIPPSLVALDKFKALTSNCFYLLKFLKRITERNHDTSLHPVPVNLRWRQLKKTLIEIKKVLNTCCYIITKCQLVITQQGLYIFANWPIFGNECQKLYYYSKSEITKNNLYKLP